MSPGDENLLRRLQCPNGCSVTWLQGLYYEDEGPENGKANAVRIEDEVRRPGLPSLYRLGVRCANCGHRYGFKDVPSEVRNAFTRHLHDTCKALHDFVDELDDAKLRKRAQRTLEEGLQ